MGSCFDGEPQSACKIPASLFEKRKIGEITSGIYNPALKVNTGIALLLKSYLDKVSEVKVEVHKNDFKEGIICSLPFNVSKNYELINQIRSKK